MEHPPLAWIRLRGARVHNLKQVDLDLPTGQLVVFSGVSGSGKSSIAFDTLFAEGQRRYVESLSSHIRRHLDHLRRAEIDHLEGLSPTLAIEQKSAGKNPRSSVATMTEIHDYLRVLWARLATAYCPVSGKPLGSLSQEAIVAQIGQRFADQRILLLAPLVEQRKGEFEQERLQWQAQGFVRALVDGQLLETSEPWQLDPGQNHSISLLVDRLLASDATRLAEAVFKTLELSQGLCLVSDSEAEESQLFATQGYSVESGLSYRALEPEDFSYNSEKGMCPTCHGLGWAAEWDLEQAIDPQKSIAQDCCILATSYQTVRYFNIYHNLARLFHFDVHTPWKELSQEAKEIFLRGSGQRWLRMEFVHPETGKTWSDRVCWTGVLQEAWQRYQGYKTERAKQLLKPYLKEGVCTSCQGDRLKPYPAAARLGSWTLAQFCRLTTREALSELRRLPLEPFQRNLAREMIEEVARRLEFLCDVGLDYLALDRTAPTLSGGEAQRVRLSSQIGSGLVGVTYILDEPSIGLHARDNERLIRTLRRLSDRGSNVIVVEHDEETILSADYVVDFGPGAGSEGGRVVYSGTVEGLLQHPDSLTGAYLSGRQQLPPARGRTPTEAKLKLHGARHHNLKGFDLELPLGLFVVVTGVSGSGKSSLISETLYPALINRLHQGQLPVGAHGALTGVESIEKVIGIDQSPIGRLPRSNPATYIKLFDEIRELFSQLPESKARGYEPGRFSFNVKEGSCVHCQGMGYVRLDMDFLDDEYVLCPKCEGQQFDEATLSIRYKNHTIREILSLSVDEAAKLFSEQPRIVKKLELLQQVGLGYLPLGQPSPQLSGGEAQRIKLARELSKSATGPTLYILDEPTTGLHLRDIGRLIEVVQRLVDRGHTVLMIEHHLEVIRRADWLIEIGPEGGDAGGHLVAQGPPELIAQVECPTGVMLRQGLRVQRRDDSQQPRFIEAIEVRGARQHNLKGIDVRFAHGQMSLLTGPSGSGKSSLALDTLYAAGQRKYVDSLSPYARQFVKPMPQPRVERIEGLSPAIAVETKETVGNQRSTVGTLTEIYDYLRLLYTRLGIAYCPHTGERVESVDVAWVRERIHALPKGSKLQLLVPYLPVRGESPIEGMRRLLSLGFSRVRLEGELYDIDPALESRLEALRTRKVTLEVVVDRLRAHSTESARLDSSIELASSLGKGVIILSIEGERGWRDEQINMGFCVPSTGASYPSVTPQLFAFNTDEGACPACQGIGQVEGLDWSSLANQTPTPVGRWLETLLDSASKLKETAFLKSIWKKPLCQLSSFELERLIEGEPDEGSCCDRSLRWRGLATLSTERLLFKQMPNAPKQLVPCPCCEGSRLSLLARNVRVEGKSLAELVKEPIPELLEFIEAIRKKRPSTADPSERVLEEILDQLQARLSFLIDVGLGYLQLGRSAPTLSGGEAQRIRLAAQLGASLTGILYVLDEPSSGLHPRDTLRLLKALEKLKELGNTLIVVDHQPHLLHAADKIYEMGPGASAQGGRLLRQATPRELIADPSSPTGRFLKEPAAFKSKLRKASGWLRIRGARAFQLKGIDLDLPLGVLCALTGVSGSGKSTLLEKVIWQLWKQLPPGADQIEQARASIEGFSQLETVEYIDSEPLGLTARSDVGTYVALLTKIREFFAQLPSAKAAGLKPAHFSTNVKQGMCKTCQGLGYRSVDLRFMPAVQLPCPLCQGLRLNPVSLSVTYQGLNFGQLLQKSADELVRLFEAQPAIHRRLKALQDVGLGYLPIGFEVAHLSIGESQRLKLAARLRRSRKKSLLLIDEPCKGLHPTDVEHLQSTLEKLVEQGHTILCIEHQLSFIARCDWLIELGPEAGAHGGELIAAGPPREIAMKQLGATGQQLAALSLQAEPPT